jgi:hypothetical protein
MGFPPEFHEILYVIPRREQSERSPESAKFIGARFRVAPARALALSKSGPAAALAFDHLVALFQQALALAILAFLLFLDVGAFGIGHDRLPAMILSLRP